MFTDLLEGLIAAGAHGGRTDLSLVSVDSTTVRAHHDAAGLRVSKHLMEALEEAAQEQAAARQKGRSGGTERTGRAPTHPTQTQAPPEGSSARQVPGCLTSKIHLAADRRCRPLALVLTVGQAGDSPQFVPVLAKVRIRLPVGRPRTKPGAVAY